MESIDRISLNESTNHREGVSADVFVFGIPVWNPTYECFSQWWENLLRCPERHNYAICLANAYTFNLTSRHREFRECVKSMDIVLNDGAGYRIASTTRGIHTQYNFNGTDLIPRLFSELHAPLRVFFYGASDAANEATAQHLAKKYPLMQIAGRINGFVEEAEAQKMIAESSADLLLVAMGHPKQELFMKNYQDRLNVKAMIGVGGLFDFVSGLKPRAPKKVRDWGFEWVFRLAIEPKRMFRRYVIGNPVFIIRCFWYLRRDLRLMRTQQISTSANSASKT